tara:strand:- start:3110 stop:3412 length:303 start_codon:yes stop_codon:yes gene_type:complete
LIVLTLIGLRFLTKPISFFADTLGGSATILVFNTMFCAEVEYRVAAVVGFALTGAHITDTDFVEGITHIPWTASRKRRRSTVAGRIDHRAFTTGKQGTYH